MHPGHGAGSCPAIVALPFHVSPPKADGKALKVTGHRKGQVPCAGFKLWHVTLTVWFVADSEAVFYQGTISFEKS